MNPLFLSVVNCGELAEPNEDNIKVPNISRFLLPSTRSKEAEADNFVHKQKKKGRKKNINKQLQFQNCKELINRR